RQIKLIDDLEQGEQDADRLSNLFQMDHLATRMRRNSENLLVLAGHEATRRWNQPVALVDVLRAAVSEIEQYERVRLNVQPGIAVRGHAVNDVVHLLAELAENATSFSSADTPVVVAGHLLSSGGVLLDITDQGVGMGAEEMAHANWRLDNPPVVDVAVSRRMGLFVVARLAARHGIRVRLRPAPAGGLTALVWLPDEVVSREAGVSAPPRFELPAMSAPVTPAPAGPARGRNGAGPSRAPVAEPETNPGRVPRFGPLRAGPWRREPDDDSGTRPQRVPGPGDRSAYAGQGSGMTNPLPKVGSEPAEAEVAAEPGEWSGDRDRPRVVGGGRGRGRGADAPAADGGVVVPPADPTAGNRLPIFEAVESDWFRRGRSGAPASSLSGSPRGRARRSATVAAAPSAPESEVAWRASGADEGWEAAAAAKAPSTGGTTNAGLPRRVPRANLVPGAAPPESVSPVPTRSAATTRDRFASFQRGIREGRAAASRDEGDSDGDDGS
ncbi:MAG: hypothetical protein J2P29_11340, partial [Actinobacteria bacterium]|nr:hypothetical protein [Actinomycetota bacterium]